MTRIHPTALIHPSVELGRNVHVGAYTVIHENVSIGDDTYHLLARLASARRRNTRATSTSCTRAASARRSASARTWSSASSRRSTGRSRTSP